MLSLKDVATVVGLTVGFTDTLAAQSLPSHPPALDAANEAYYVANEGQWPERVRYLLRRPEMMVEVQESGLGVHLGVLEGGRWVRAHYVTFEFENGAADVEVTGTDQQDARWNFLVGDQASWRSGVPGYGSVIYQGVHPGVDVRLRRDGGLAEYDLLLAADAMLDSFVVRVAGADGLSIRANGALEVKTADGILVQRPPVAWEVGVSGERRALECRFVLLGEDRYGFVAPQRTPGSEAVVDPTLEWSTFLGAGSYEYARSVAIGGDGSAYVTGYASSATFPKTAGAYDVSFNGSNDGFISKLSPNGATLVYSTFLGGGLEDTPRQIAVTSSGEATVVGFTTSLNFPTTTSAPQRRNLGGFGEVFVTRLNAAGTRLAFSTYLGGTDYDFPGALAVDSTGATTVVGWTKSTDFPRTQGAYSTVYKNKGDGFVTRINAAGTAWISSTYLGSQGWEEPHGVVVDGGGNSWVAGTVWEAPNGGSDFPTTSGAYDRSYNGGQSDAFLAKLNGAGTTLIYGSFFGGSARDRARGIESSPTGIVFGGASDSSDLPTTAGAYDRSANGAFDAFVARLDNSGARLVASTYVGTAKGDGAYRIALDASGGVHVGGFTEDVFPTTANAIQRTYGGGRADGFVASFDSGLSRLTYGTMVGGSSYDSVYDLRWANGAVTAAGEVFSTGFPSTRGSYDGSYNGGGDAFITRIRIGTYTPGVFTTYGAGCPGTGGRIPAHDGSGRPDIGNAMGWMVRQARAGAPAVLLLGGTRQSLDLTAIGMPGCTLLTTPLATISTASNAQGIANVNFTIPMDGSLIGGRAFTQYAIVDTGSPTSLKIVVSNGLEMRIGGTR